MQSRRRDGGDGGGGDGRGDGGGYHGAATITANLNCLQINCARDFAVMTQLQQILVERRIDVAILQEPMGYQRIQAPSGYQVFSAIGRHGTPYAAIIAREALCPMRVQDPNEQNGVCISLNWCGTDIFLASVYCQWRGDMAPYIATMRNFIAIAAGRPLLLGIDANASSQTWHSKPGRANNNRLRIRGDVLNLFISAENLAVLNRPSELYTFIGRPGRRRRKVSDVDVTLANEAWSTKFDSWWKIETALTTSDHNAILIDVTKTIDGHLGGSEPPLRWNQKNIDWIEFEGAIRTEMEQVDISQGTVDDAALSFGSAIHRVNDTLCQRMVTRRNKNPWWSPALIARRRKVRAARKKWQIAFSRQPYAVGERAATYRNEQRLYKAELLRAKEASWRNFVSTEGNENPWGKVYRFCRGKQANTSIPAISDDNGVPTTSRADSLNVLLSSFFPLRPDDERNIADGENIGEPFEEAEISEAVFRFRRDKAPGPDGFTASMVRHVWHAVPDKFRQLLERCRIESEFPSAWKTARLVILLKSPDKDESDRRSYRPICLLSTIGKTLERVMVNRLTRNEPSHPNQYGFTLGRGAEDVLLRARAEANVCNKRYLLGIFVDFRGAFDNLRWDCVMEKLAATGGESGLWRSYFRDRSVYVDNGDTAVRRDVQRGCPQGSICGPAIWNLMMAVLLNRLEEAGFKALAYADDLLLLVPGNTRLELEREAPRYMAIVEQWGSEVGVPINEQKTVHMMLKGELAASRPPTVRYGDKTVASATAVKYLGVKMNATMTFRAHFESIVDKVAKLSNALRRVTRKEWGLTRRTTLVLYRGLFVPVMGYASLFWADSTRLPKERQLLLRAQRSALYVALPFCVTVSLAAMQVIAGQLPWDLEARRLAVMAKQRRGIELLPADLVQQTQLDRVNFKKRAEIVKETFFDEWQSRWDNDPHGRVTAKWIPNVRYCKENAFFSPTMELMFLITGYGSLNATLSVRTREAPEPTCPTCGAANEDWEHVLVSCPTYEDIRDLDEWHVVLNPDGSADVSQCLLDRNSFISLNDFARAAFARRKAILEQQA